jgi:hypothetical protein
MDTAVVTVADTLGIMPSAETLAAGAASADTAVAAVAPADTAAAGTPAEASGVPMVVAIDGLEIEEVSDATLRGQAGYRVVQRLDSGAFITIESFPDTTAGPGVGRPTYTAAGDTTIAIVRFEGRMVYASAVLVADSLGVLLGRLIKRARPPEP